MPTDYSTMVQYAMALSRATIVPQELRGRPENVIAVMAIARALQLPLSTVMQNVFTSRERVAERSRLLHMLARRAGHRIQFERLDDTEATALLWLHDHDDEIEVTYTILEARDLGLMEPEYDPYGHWVRQPANMLRNRVITRAVDWHCPEVKMGADWSADGGLLMAGADVGEGMVVTGQGPEVSRLQQEINAATRLDDPDTRSARLNELWQESRLLLTEVIDGTTTTLQTVLTDAMRQAHSGTTSSEDELANQEAKKRDQRRREAQRVLDERRAAHPAFAGPRHHPDQQEDTEEVPDLLACGCRVDDVTRTGTHAASCGDLTARLAREARPR